MVKKIFENNMKLEMDSVSENESLARMGVASFLTKIDPTLEEINDIKTAVSEAVTNSIIHGYRDKKGIVEIKCHLRETIIEKEDEILHISLITIIVRDDGTGIDDIEKILSIVSFIFNTVISPHAFFTSLYLPKMTPIPELSINVVLLKLNITFFN